MKVGITGHRKFQDVETIEWIKSALQQFAEKNQLTTGFTALATGADQLFAEMLIRNRVGYIAVIPCDNYDQTFVNAQDRMNYIKLKAGAKSIIALGFSEPSEKAFYDAGKEVVNQSEVLIAIWNGERSKGLGGTADVVDFAIEKNIPVVHFDITTKIVSPLNNLSS